MIIQWRWSYKKDIGKAFLRAFLDQVEEICYFDSDFDSDTKKVNVNGSNYFLLASTKSSFGCNFAFLICQSVLSSLVSSVWSSPISSDHKFSVLILHSVQKSWVQK